MKTQRRHALLSLFLALSMSASASPIPADLEARASTLRGQASPAVLSWVHDQGAALAKKTGPVDTAALESHAGAIWTAPANVHDADIEALCFLVLMAAAKSAEEDLKAVMAAVETANAQKAQHHTPTPTPAPDRVGPLVAAARKIEPKTQGANLAKLARR